jgi:hypothetical protein
VRWAIAILLVLSAGNITDGGAQHRVLTAGMKVRPFFSSKFFKTGPQQKDSSQVQFTVKPVGGYSVGGVVRYGISHTLSFETGIHFIKRPYRVSLEKTDGNHSVHKVETRFSSISYEIPTCLLVFLQLSEHLFMDVFMGFSMDFYPSNLNTTGEHFNHYSVRKNWIFPSVKAGLGYEWRTAKKGYFYLGASYHQPLDDIFVTTIGYYENGRYQTGQQFILSGNYLAIDLAYFFHQEPLKKPWKKVQ